jgi:hypothetical protein
VLLLSLFGAVARRAVAGMRVPVIRSRVELLHKPADKVWIRRRS